MNQGILLFCCLIFVGLVVGAPAGDDGLVTPKQFTAEDCGKSLQEISNSKCRALIPRFKWSVEKQDCVEAFYGGCNPSANNFNSKANCVKIARPVCHSATNGQIYC